MEEGSPAFYATFNGAIFLIRQQRVALWPNATSKPIIFYFMVHKLVGILTAVILRIERKKLSV
jgi:hypothetical protein